MKTAFSVSRFTLHASRLPEDTAGRDVVKRPGICVREAPGAHEDRPIFRARKRVREKVFPVFTRKREYGHRHHVQVPAGDTARRNEEQFAAVLIEPGKAYEPDIGPVNHPEPHLIEPRAVHVPQACCLLTLNSGDDVDHLTAREWLLPNEHGAVRECASKNPLARRRDHKRMVTARNRCSKRRVTRLGVAKMTRVTLVRNERYAGIEHANVRNKERAAKWSAEHDICLLPVKCPVFAEGIPDNQFRELVVISAGNELNSVRPGKRRPEKVSA